MKRCYALYPKHRMATHSASFLGQIFANHLKIMFLFVEIGIYWAKCCRRLRGLVWPQKEAERTPWHLRAA